MSNVNFYIVIQDSTKNGDSRGKAWCKSRRHHHYRQHHYHRKHYQYQGKHHYKNRSFISRMGQTASKKGVETAIKKTFEKRVGSEAMKSPPPSSLSQPSSQKSSQAANPHLFLRGEGAAQQDIRDVTQEMYLQQMHNIDDEKKIPREMPDDLIKFIQDVGPARQSVDTEYTSPRLLEKENKEELLKAESTRQPGKRERTRMPLMGGDVNFAEVRNTYFSASKEDADGNKDFGLSTTQLHDFLSKYIAPSSKHIDDAEIEEFYNSSIGAEEEWTAEESEQHKRLLKHTLEMVRNPVLHQDMDGNLVGIHPDEVPGPEVRSVRAVLPTKARLVLDDLRDNSPSAVADDAAKGLHRRRQLRKSSA